MGSFRLGSIAMREETFDIRVLKRPESFADGRIGEKNLNSSIVDG